MQLLPIAAAVLLAVQLGSAQYDVTLLLLSFDNGQGFLANSSHCDPFWYANKRCSISLDICIELISQNHSTEVGECRGTAFSLPNVTRSSNKVDFEETVTYGNFSNPTTIQAAGQEVYEGFQIKVTATHGDAAALIDSYVYVVDDTGTKVHDEFDNLHYRLDAPQPTRLKGAVLVVGNTRFGPITTTGSGTVATEQAETQLTTAAEEQPTQPTQPEAPTASEGPAHTEGPTTTTAIPSTTSEKPKAQDCDDYTYSGVKEIWLDDTTNVNVYCDRGNFISYTVIQSRGEQDNSSFNVSYADYKKPVGTPGKATNFWLGLENIYKLIKHKAPGYYALAIQLCCGSTEVASQFYGSVSLSDETTFYILNATSQVGTGLANQYVHTDLGAPFSVANDVAGWNNPNMTVGDCDVVMDDAPEGGWWFGSCTNNLNGYYYSTSRDATSFDNATVCLLKGVEDLSLPHGSGIEMNLAADGAGLNGLSYSRVRMALYQNSKQATDIPSLCRD